MEELTNGLIEGLIEDLIEELDDPMVTVLLPQYV